MHAHVTIITINDDVDVCDECRSVPVGDDVAAVDAIDVDVGTARRQSDKNDTSLRIR